jgi:MFS family permease
MTTAVATAGRYAGMRDFLLIWAGQLISLLGTRFSIFGLSIWALEEMKFSVLQFSLIFVAMSVPALLVLPFAGALVDRWDRRRIMITCEVISALVVTVLATITAMGELALWHVYIGVGISSLCSAFLQPAYQASIPMLVSRDKLAQVNSLSQVSNAIALLGGPVLAAIFYAWIGIAGVLYVDAVSFAIGAVLISLAVVRNPPRDANAPAKPNLLREAREGWRYIADRPGMAGLLMVFGAVNFFYGIAAVSINPLVLSMGDKDTLATQMVAGGLGLLLGGYLVGRTGGPKRKVDGVLGLSLIGGVLMSLHGLYPSVYLIMACGFALFSTIPMVHTSNAILWQTKVPPQLQGRCFAFLRIMTEAVMPLGYVLAGPLAEFVFEPALMPGGALADTVGAVIGTGAGRGLAFMFVLIGIGMVLVSAIGYSVRAIRRIDDELPDALPSAPAPAPAAG